MSDPAALYAQDDAALAKRVRTARAAGDSAASTLALRLLVFRHAGDTARRLALRVAPDAVDDAAHDALVDALEAAVAGEDGLRARLDAAIAREAAARRLPPGGARAGEHEDEDDLWAAGELWEGPTGEPGAPVGDASPPATGTRADEGLLAGFREELAAGEEADPRAALAAVAAASRATLAAALERELAGRAGRPWDARAFARLSEDELGQRVVASLEQGVEPWPAFLPRLRRRARVSLPRLAERAAAELGRDSGEVRERVEAMEAGGLAAEGVDEALVEALAHALDTPADVLRRAGEGGRRGTAAPPRPRSPRPAPPPAAPGR